MHRVYEVFEVLPNGVPQRVTVVTGLEAAKLRLQALARRTTNECFVTDADTHQIVAQMNVPALKRRNVKRILVISYDEQMGLQRAAVLKSRGYETVSIVGNEAAKILLTPSERYDLFIVGHSAPAKTRQEMVAWLKEKSQRVKIIALNPPGEKISGADYNVQHGADFERPPRVKCSRDGQAMYLAEVKPEKRSFRLWRCPQCDAIRTNEEGLVKESPQEQQG